MVGPSLFGASFAYAISPGMPTTAAGTPFYIAGAIQVLGLLGILAFTRSTPFGHAHHTAA
jgi:hypothetical protein